MSTSLKLILPLNTDVIKKEHLTKECGFVDAFTNDINNPYLDNHIFLMYDLNLNTSKEIERASYFAGKGIIPRIMNISGKMYSIYTIEITNKGSISYKITNYPSTFTEEDYIKIIRFWNMEDSDVNNFILNGKLNEFKYEKTILPEANLMLDEYNTNFLTIEKAPRTE